MIFAENLAYEKKNNYWKGEVEALIGLGKATQGLGDYTQAKQYFAEALNVGINFHQILETLDAMAAAAELLLQLEDRFQALALLTVVLNHRATSHETKTRAQALYDHLESQLSPQVMDAAIEQAKARRLDSIIQAFFDRQLLITGSQSFDTEQPAPGPLTDRELEILGLLAEGQSNREIAERLFLALSTVKWHLNIINTKLHVASRTQAVAHARALNLLT